MDTDCDWDGGRDIGSPTPNLAIEIADFEVSCSFTRGAVLKFWPLLACYNSEEDDVIPCKGTLDASDRPFSLSPIPVDGNGQPLLSTELTFSLTV